MEMIKTTRTLVEKLAAEANFSTRVRVVLIISIERSDQSPIASVPTANAHGPKVEGPMVIRTDVPRTEFAEVGSRRRDRRAGHLSMEVTGCATLHFPAGLVVLWPRLSNPPPHIGGDGNAVLVFAANVLRSNDQGQ